MPDETLSAALEREHQEVDSGLASFLDKLASGTVDADRLYLTLHALRRHIYLEEQILFPPLRQGALMASIFGMIRGHGEIWRTMDTLTELAADGIDHEKIGDVCGRLVNLLAEHNKVEEPVIYPVADTGLDEVTATELSSFIKSGQLPDGWVCAKAVG